MRASGNDCLAINVFHNYCGDDPKRDLLFLEALTATFSSTLETQKKQMR